MKKVLPFSEYKTEVSDSNKKYWNSKQKPYCNNKYSETSQ